MRQSLLSDLFSSSATSGTSTTASASKRARATSDDSDDPDRRAAKRTGAISEASGGTRAASSAWHGQANSSSDDAETLAHDSELSRLSRLLDLTGLTAHSDIHARFSLIADALLTRFRLCVCVTPLGGGRARTLQYEILELEFYLRKAGVHEDPFTHGSEEQKRTGRWCVYD